MVIALAATLQLIDTIKMAVSAARAQYHQAVQTLTATSTKHTETGLDKVIHFVK